MHPSRSGGVSRPRCLLVLLLAAVSYIRCMLTDVHYWNLVYAILLSPLHFCNNNNNNNNSCNTFLANTWTERKMHPRMETGSSGRGNKCYNTTISCDQGFSHMNIRVRCRRVANYRPPSDYSWVNFLVFFLNCTWYRSYLEVKKDKWIMVREQDVR